MTLECRHCGALVSGKAYRVTSEDGGVKLLDMIVCYCCFIEAQRLGLHTEEMNTVGMVTEPRPRDSAGLY